MDSRFDIPYTDDPEDSKLEIIVQLSQKDARSTLLSDQRQNLVIGFHIMKVEANRRYRVHQVIYLFFTLCKRIVQLGILRILFMYFIKVTFLCIRTRYFK